MDQPTIEKTCDKLYILPVYNEYLLYSPLRGISALVNQEAADIIFGNVKIRKNKDQNVQEFVHLLENTKPAFPEPMKGEVSPVFLGILPTRQCNMRCLYCDFEADSKDHQILGYDRAVAAVDWMTRQTMESGKDIMGIHFFGGEPFMAPDVVEVVVHHARMAAGRTGLATYFEAATNGVFDEKTARFIGDYFNTIVLSMDGEESVHNRYRPLADGSGSYRQVWQTARILSESDVELCLRICVTSENVHNLEQIARYYCERLAPTAINFETLKMNEKTASAGLEPPDPYHFAANCFDAFKTIQSFGVRPVYATADHAKIRYTFCPLGNDALIVTPRGEIKGCYLPDREWKKKDLDLHLGSIDPKGNLKLKPASIEGLRNLVRSKNFCKDCYCYWSCAGGCHVSNHGLKGFNDLCIQTRLLTLCFLLRDLGMDDTAERLLNDRQEMEKIVKKAVAVEISDLISRSEYQTKPGT